MAEKLVWKLREVMYSKMFWLRLDGCRFPTVMVWMTEQEFFDYNEDMLYYLAEQIEYDPGACGTRYDQLMENIDFCKELYHEIMVEYADNVKNIRPSRLRMFKSRKMAENFIGSQCKSTGICYFPVYSKQTDYYILYPIAVL